LAFISAFQPIIDNHHLNDCSVIRCFYKLDSNTYFISSFFSKEKLIICYGNESNCYVTKVSGFLSVESFDATTGKTHSCFLSKILSGQQVDTPVNFQFEGQIHPSIREDDSGKNILPKDGPLPINNHEEYPDDTSFSEGDDGNAERKFFSRKVFRFPTSTHTKSATFYPFAALTLFLISLVALTALFGPDFIK